MAPITFEASLPHPDDTDKLGSRLADAVSNEAACVTDHGLAIRLQGNLGAGKDRRWFEPCYAASALPAPVKSPTFSLVETYPIGALTLNHFDFYRFEEPEEFEDARFSAICSAPASSAPRNGPKKLPHMFPKQTSSLNSNLRASDDMPF